MTTNDPTSLSDDRVIRLFYDSRGQLWIGTVDGLNRFDPATGTFTTYRHGKPDTQHVYRSIVEDARGTLWLDADGDGVQRFDPDTGRFTPVRLQHASESPLLYKRVQSLHVDHAGAVWAGTGNGLYRYDVETGASTYYTERDGLPSNTVSCIFEDEFGELWMGTSEGLSRLDRSRKIFKNYSLADGLPGLDFTGWSACFRGASGEMFFGGFAGARRVPPGERAGRRLRAADGAHRFPARPVCRWSPARIRRCLARSATRKRSRCHIIKTASRSSSPR